MKSLSRAVFLIGMVVCAAALAHARDNGRITGNVTSLSGSPLRNAIIRVFQEVEDGEILTLIRSDQGGFFKTAALNPGIYYLQVSRQGYQPVTTTRFAIDEYRAISLDIALQELAGYVSRDEDARNWDVKKVMRTTSDRRLIFRTSPLEVDAEPEMARPFSRSGAMSIASDSSGESEGYQMRPHQMRPQSGQSGVSSSFALAEPLNAYSRIILSGQVDIGSGSFWRIRNTYNYRPDRDHDFRASVGYGRWTGNYPSSSSISSSSNLLPVESGIETFAFSMEGSTSLFDMLAVKYGLDYSRLYYGKDKSYLYPSIQILLTPMDGWNFQTSLTSRRIRDTNSITLPDGEILNLSEPAIITLIGNKVSMSQVRHAEISAQHLLNPDTLLEFAFYQDDTEGPGIPLLVTAVTPMNQRSQLIEMNEDDTSQRGMRLTMKHKVFEYLKGSIAYVYGEAKGISKDTGLLSSAMLETNPGSFLRQQYQHSITGRIDAAIPFTGTNVLTTVRWNSGNPLTALDWFSDHMDISTKSTNFEIRQALPFPEFMGARGRWEFMLDLRNILNQGQETLSTAEGQLVLNRNPRSVRFGLNYSFR